MDEEFDSVVFEDENGNEMVMDILDMFEHKTKKYVVLSDHMDCEDDFNSDRCACGCDCGDDDEFSEETGIYIMEVQSDSGEEKFVDIEDQSELEEVLEAFTQRLDTEEENQ